MSKRIGLVVGPEQAFEEALLERCRRHAGISAGLAEIGGTTDRWVSGYDVLIDRASRAVPHYRAYLKTAALAGATVINDPFWSCADDRFFACSVAARLGITVPHTSLLPQNAYGPEVDHAQGLRNLECPIRWQDIARYVELPAVLRPVAFGSGVAPAVVSQLDELWPAFDASQQNVMMLQHRITCAQHVQAIVVGRQEVVLTELESEASGAACVPHADDSWLTEAIAQRVSDAARRLCAAFGHDLGGMRFGICDGQPVLLDGVDPFPALEALPAPAFDAVLDHLAEVAIAAAHGRKLAMSGYLWARQLGVPNAT